MFYFFSDILEKKTEIKKLSAIELYPFYKYMCVCIYKSQITKIYHTLYIL